MSFTEYMITFAIIMMVLSSVSERLSNFFKLYFDGKTIVIPFLHWRAEPYTFKNLSYILKVRIKILATKQANEKAEKEREYRIMVINILIGIILATLANANFFQIIEKISEFDPENTRQTLNIIPGWVNASVSTLVAGGFFLSTTVWIVSVSLFSRLQEVPCKIKNKWIYAHLLVFMAIFLLAYLFIPVLNEKELKSLLSHSMGYIVTGLFLSLGSKFWHDLLGILYKYKNARQTLSKADTYTSTDDPKKIQALTEVSHYEIADKLLKKYEKDIKAIEDVIAVDFMSELDPADGLFKRKIEVEFTTSEAQLALEKLAKTAAVEINYNTFYLRDYMRVLYSDEYAAQSNFIQDIKEKEPVCYAYNDKSPDNMGSFNVLEKDGKFFAQSNLHVFASTNDFSALADSDSFTLRDNTVLFIVGDGKFNGTIVDYSFGNDVSKKDYALCEIDKALYDAYLNLIQPEDKIFKYLMPDGELKMFGATSKYADFKPINYNEDESQWCRINYGTFKKEMHLQKITRTSSYTQKGDSGATIYYKTKNFEGDIVLKKGILVSGNRNYSRMFIL